jgi:CRP/FNR family cyclic AMP-dependent transcriptional regulator
MAPIAVASVPASAFPASRKARSKSLAFNVESFLDSSGLGKSVASFSGKEVVLRQGDPATPIFYIRRGGVKLTVVNKPGKEAVLAILGPGDFFGEGCLTAQSISVATSI